MTCSRISFKCQKCSSYTEKPPAFSGREPVLGLVVCFVEEGHDLGSVAVPCGTEVAGIDTVGDAVFNSPQLHTFPLKYFSQLL